MRARAARFLAPACFAAVCGAPLAAQEAPLRRTFVPGAVESFRVEAALRLELRGVEAETIGAKAYVKPFTRAAEATLRWTAVRRIGAADPSGWTAIEETIEQPGAECPADGPADHQTEVLREAAQKFCESWKTPRMLRYQESPGGQLRNFPQVDTAELDDPGCGMLPLWSRHAWRPSVLLPVHALRPGERWEERSQFTAGRWAKGESIETTGWLARPGDSTAATLHVVQQLTGPEERLPRSTITNAPPGRTRTSFFAESLSTVSLLDASLLEATRSAACETAIALEPVEGLPDPPRFSSKLSLTVSVRRRQ